MTQSIELVRRAQDGQKEALDQLLARYYERVRPMVSARLGSQMRVRVDSMDILQETFIYAVSHFDQFEMRDEASLIQWLAKIAENRVREKVQKVHAHKRDPRLERPLDGPTDSQEGVGADLAESGGTPSVILSEAEEKARYEKCLGELKPDYREVILLRNYAGSTWAAVAEAMGLASPNAARMLHARAMAGLAGRVAGFGQSESSGA